MHRLLTIFENQYLCSVLLISRQYINYVNLQVRGTASGVWAHSSINHFKSFCVNRPSKLLYHLSLLKCHFQNRKENYIKSPCFTPILKSKSNTRNCSRMLEYSPNWCEQFHSSTGVLICLLQCFSCMENVYIIFQGNP